MASRRTPTPDQDEPGPVINISTVAKKKSPGTTPAIPITPARRASLDGYGTPKYNNHLRVENVSRFDSMSEDELGYQKVERNRLLS